MNGHGVGLGQSRTLLRAQMNGMAHECFGAQNFIAVIDVQIIASFGE